MVASKMTMHRWRLFVAATPLLFTLACGGGGDGSPPSSAAGGGAGASPDGSEVAGAAGAPVVEPEVREVCSVDDFCWVSPAPQGNDLRATWGASLTAVWAVGSAGAVLAFDGYGWRREPLPQLAGESSAGPNLRDVWGRDAADVWTVGDDGAVYRRGAAGWTQVPLTPAGEETVMVDLHAVHGDGDSVFVVGAASGAVFRFVGDGWLRVPVPAAGALRDVLVLDDDDVWAVGDGGAVVHFDGERWVAVDVGLSDDLVTITGTRDDLWVASSGGAVRRHDGAGWAVADVGLPLSALVAAPGDGAVEATVWVVGDEGLVLRREASGWRKMPSGTTRAFAAGWSGKAGEVFLVGVGGLMEYWQGDARQILSPGGGSNILRLEAPGGGALWTLGDDVHRVADGAMRPSEVPTGRAIYGSSFATQDDGWAVGTGGTILRWSGGRWSVIDGGVTAWLRGIWVDRERGWIVGEGGTLLERTSDATWSAVDGGTDASLHAVWRGEETVWAVGDGGVILTGRDGVWESAPPPGSGPMVANLRAVHGTTDSNVWVGGTNGTLARWDGVRWTVTATGAGHSINGLFAVAEDDVWAVGTGGTLRHWDGVRWTPHDAGTRRQLAAVVVDDGGAVWVGGASGTLLVRRP